MVNWVSNLIVAMTFLEVVHLFTRQGAFLFYGAIALLGWFFFYIHLPETRGRSLEEVTALFEGSSKDVATE